MTGTDKYERDMSVPLKTIRGGRIDMRIFQNEDDVGDGNPGLQKVMRNLMSTFYDKYVMEGCVYSGTTLTAGYIMYQGVTVKVSQQTITVNNSEYLYLDSSGVAHTTSVLATAEAGLILFMRDGSGVGTNIRTDFEDNQLYLYKLIVKTDLEVDGNIDVSGDMTLSGDMEVTGTLTVDTDLDLAGDINMSSGDITGVGTIYGDNIDLNIDLDLNDHSLIDIKQIDGGGNDVIFDDDINMNSNNINNVASLDNGGLAISIDDDLDLNGNNLNHVASIDNDGSAIQLDDNLNVNSNNLQNVNDADINGNIDCEGTADINGNVDLHGDLDLHNGNLDDVATIDGGGNAIQLDDDLDVNSNNLDNVATIDNGGSAIQLDDDLDVNDNNIDNVKVFNDLFYYCSTETEINNAITAIGTGAGFIIILPGTISLTSTITIGGGGTYIIRGCGRETTIDCGGNRSAFDITSVNNCDISDLRVDGRDFSDYSYYAINVSSANVRLNNLYIWGDGTHGMGVLVEAQNVCIRDCYIASFYRNVVINGSASDTKIENCVLHDGYIEGIRITGGTNHTIEGCKFTGSGNYSIEATSGTRIFINKCDFSKAAASFTTINSLNITNNCFHDSSAETALRVYQNNRSVITGNIIYNYTGGDYFFGIDFAASVGSGHTSVISNNVIYSCSNNSTGGYAVGIQIEAYANTVIVANNIVRNISGPSNIVERGNYGIHINRDEVVLAGNLILAVTCSGSGTGYGIHIDSGADQTTIDSNTALNCDTNYSNNGTNQTVGDNNTA